MPKYTPIDVIPQIRCSFSDMIEARCKGRSLIADFIIPDDAQHALRAQFEQSEIIRILDEMPLSTEPEPTPNEGLIADHFAYSVEGALFYRCQSEALKMVHPRLRHYRLITGWTCVDVLSTQEPTFQVVPLSEPEQRAIRAR